jgi:hypothetical protein
MVHVKVAETAKMGLMDQTVGAAEQKVTTQIRFGLLISFERRRVFASFEEHAR